MTNEEELKKIKKIYGEKFMKLCRELFPTILEQEGKLLQILSQSFSENCKNLYEDIRNQSIEAEFKNYVYSQVNVESIKENELPTKTPYELLDEAGYVLTECHNEAEIQQFEKYYAPGEQLCTFFGGRLNRCVVFWAVKKDVDKIKREDFNNPQREDEYGTSVMGIQFSKTGMCTVSIKNRYNHTVNNPDATYGNDLDRIIPGLTESFAVLLKNKGLDLNNSNIEELQINGYVVAEDGKYYKYNFEYNGRYFCPGNIIIDNGEVVKLKNPEKQMLIDNFILDMKNKNITPYVEWLNDSFIDGLQNIEKIEVIKHKENDQTTKNIMLQISGNKFPVIIKIDQYNNIIGYENKDLERIGNDFLARNKNLRELKLPNVTRIESNFLVNNLKLEEIILPNVTNIRDNFLTHNIILQSMELPNLTKVGNNFASAEGVWILAENMRLREVDFPRLEEVGNCFLTAYKSMKKVNMPTLNKAGDYFLSGNENITELELPLLEKIGDYALRYNKVLNKLELPNLKEVGHRFLIDNQCLTKMHLPSLERTGDFFCSKKGSFFFSGNTIIKDIYLPELTEVGDDFLADNTALKKINLPNLIKAGDDFLAQNKILSRLYMPKLMKTGSDFLKMNTELKKINLPNLEETGAFFIPSNKQINEINVPYHIKKGKFFLNSIYEQDKIWKKNKKTITSKQLAELDKEKMLTTTEIGLGKQIISRLKNIFKTKSEEER